MSVAVSTALVVRRELFSSYGAAASPSGAAPAEGDRPVKNWADLVGAGHRIGPKNSVVTIVEFADFECPACKKFFGDVEALRAKYPARIAIVFRHWPLPYHRFAYPSARAAECAAEQGQFESYYSILYTTQDSLGLISFGEMAKRAGIHNPAAFDACTRIDGKLPAVEKDVAAAKALGARGTPTIVMNGIMLGRPPSMESLEALVKGAQ